MKRWLLLALLAPTGLINAQFHPANAPVAEKKEHWRVTHGDSTLDNYYWMYDYFGKGPDSTRAVQYLQAENAYFDTVMSGTQTFQSDLFKEIRARIKEKDETPPTFKNGYYYYTRTAEGEQYYKYCRKKGSLAAREEVLLDVDRMAAGHAFYQISGLAVSQNNRFLAYGVDEVSRRQYTIHVKDLVTGKVLPDSIANTQGDACWANDNRTIFYAAKNPVTLLSERIKKHKLGNQATDDAVVYEEKDHSNYIFVTKSKNEQFIFILSRATLSSEIRFIDAGKPDDPFAVFQPRLSNVLYSVFSLGDRFLILTNKDSASNFKLMQCPVDHTDSGNWKEVIGVRPDVLIEGVEEFKDFLAIEERKAGLEKIRLFNLTTDSSFYIPTAEKSYALAFEENPQYATHTVRYNYTSLKTPYTIYDFDVNTKASKLIKQREVLGGYHPEDYTVERLSATADDGVQVPISMVYKKGFQKNGSAPLLLYGYGSYGISTDDDFRSSILTLLNRGFVFAIAHVRGGQEMGRQWYENGKLMKKKNTFTDFVACGKYLVKEKYTSSAHMFAEGGSAGGLLMGAVANISPDLWRGIVAQVPFVDVVNTMLDESIPLTTNEFDEWGNPKNNDAYFYMKSYSPYDNVAAKSYPNMLVLTGLHDSQVQYFEPSKWVAKLRALKTDNNILLLHTDMDYGHGGASGRFDYIKELAMSYAFLLTLENIHQ